ncbi:hypothetical protein [Stenotrophomonas sp.]|uniref:hypothetical protein n=1 Tax=Stenotrophomonas sp. TaxID=69392 RepID=UPI0028A96951|nr:hypothetical protein [Stenotrophomonas sp.]
MDSFEVEIIHEPKKFSEVHQDLVGALATYSPHGTNDPSVVFLRRVHIEEAEKMLVESKSASPNSEEAWYFLTKAARAVGYLAASKNAIYLRDDVEDPRAAARKNGSLGGAAKGANARKVLDDIATKMLSAEPPKGGWDKASLRRKFNEITDSLPNFADPERKFREILKREDIRRLVQAK